MYSYVCYRGTGHWALSHLLPTVFLLPYMALVHLWQVQAAVDRTAAAVAAVRAVRLTEAQWYVYHERAMGPSQALTASELCQDIASDTILASQYVYCVDGTGQACQAKLAIHEWKVALAFARQLAAGPVLL